MPSSHVSIAKPRRVSKPAGSAGTEKTPSPFPGFSPLQLANAGLTLPTWFDRHDHMGSEAKR